MNQRMFDQDTRIPGLLGYVCLSIHSFFSLIGVLTRRTLADNLQNVYDRTQAHFASLNLLEIP